MRKKRERKFAIYPVILTTSRLVSNAYLKRILMKIKKQSSRLKTFRFRFDSLLLFVIPAEAQ